MIYHNNFEKVNIEVYSYIVRKDILTHVALFGIPERIKHLRDGNFSKIVDWVQSRNGFQTYYHYFAMIILYCQSLLYNCNFEEMKKLISIIFEQSDI